VDLQQTRASDATDCMPEWSSDDRLEIFLQIIRSRRYQRWDWKVDLE